VGRQRTGAADRRRGVRATEASTSGGDGLRIRSSNLGVVAMASAGARPWAAGRGRWCSNSWRSRSGRRTSASSPTTGSPSPSSSTSGSTGTMAADWSRPPRPATASSPATTSSPTSVPWRPPSWRCKDPVGRDITVTPIRPGFI